MTTLLDSLIKNVTENVPDDSRIIKGIWSVDCLYSPNNNGRTFDYKFLVTQTKGQGCAYSANRDYSSTELRELIGQDFISHGISDTALLVSLLDSVYDKDKHTYEKRVLDAESEIKSYWRTEIIASEAKRLLGSLRGKNVVNVGVVGSFLKKFGELGCSVLGTDYDEAIIGQTLFDAPIENGDKTIEAVANADLAIVTGMTMATLTLDSILSTAARNSTKIIIFAETGANLAPFFMQYGVDVFIGEPFPFYIFNGVSEIRVYRN